MGGTGATSSFVERFLYHPADLVPHSRKEKNGMRPANYPESTIMSSLSSFTLIIGSCRTLSSPDLIESKKLNVSGDLWICWLTISRFPPSYRKSLILCCRAQVAPSSDQDTLLSNQVFGSLHPSDPEDVYTSFCRLLQDMNHLITSPIFSALIIDFCRSSPMQLSDVLSSRLKSWGKEISILEGEPRESSMNFRVWFEPLYFRESFVPSADPNPDMASHIHSLLVQWRSRQSQKTFFPRMSRKMVSLSTIRSWEYFEGRTWITREREGGVEFTQETVERYYHHTGVKLGGGCEIRQKWYRSGVSPRTYFCQGGDAFHSSKFVQEMFTDLVDSLICTDHTSRLNPTRILLQIDQYLRIYDLSGFSSNHHEQKFFLQHLARFCEGYTVQLFDAREGLIVYDLGALISEYNQNNIRSPYSLERFDGDFASVDSFHNVAGFLGVYGNLMTCTFVHGASLLQRFKDPDDINCAGDDVHFAETPGLEYLADPLIRANGVVERSKEFDSREEGAVCLKRGITQQGCRLLQKLMVIWPSFSGIGALFGFYPPQFPMEKLSRDEKLNIVGTELLRFLRSLFTAQIYDGLEYVVEFLHRLYSEASLPGEGSLPQFGGKWLMPVLPKSPEDILGSSPIRQLVNNFYVNGVVLPKRVDPWYEESTQSIPCDLYSGVSWEGFTSPYIKYLEALEYVRKDSILVFYSGLQGYDLLVQEFEYPQRQVYNFTIIRDVPLVLKF